MRNYSGEMSEPCALGSLLRPSLHLDVTKINSFPDFIQHVTGALENEWKRTSFDYLVNNAGGDC